jgi:hypothetical protein
LAPAASTACAAGLRLRSTRVWCCRFMRRSRLACGLTDDGRRKSSRHISMRDRHARNGPRKDRIEVALRPLTADEQNSSSACWPGGSRLPGASAFPHICLSGEDSSTPRGG